MPAHALFQVELVDSGLIVREAAGPSLEECVAYVLDPKYLGDRYLPGVRTTNAAELTLRLFRQWVNPK